MTPWLDTRSMDDRIYVYRWPQSKKKGKDQESIQSSTTPDTGYQWESDNFTIRHHKRDQEVSPFRAGDHKASINIRAWKHNKKAEIQDINL